MPRLHGRDAGQLSLLDALLGGGAPVQAPPAPPVRPPVVPPPDLLLDDVRGARPTRATPPALALDLAPPVAGGAAPEADATDGDASDGADADEDGDGDIVGPAAAAPAMWTRRERLVRTVQLLARLRALGLTARVTSLVLTRNRTVMASLARGVLRVHEGFAAADDAVLGAIVTFVQGRDRAARERARQVITRFPVATRPPRRPTAQHPADAPLAARLTALHAEYNARHFGGTLQPLEVRVSRRLARRLGHYTLRSATARATGEIVIGARHVRRDGWAEAAHTLLHEMVHQWQDETGRVVDHGAEFRRKCREVGITPAATRRI